VSQHTMKLVTRAFARAGWFLADCVRSPVVWLFTGLHAGWFFAAIARMGPPSRAAAGFWESFQGAYWTLFEGRPFHFYYEPWIVKSLFVADLPVLVLTAPIDILVSPLTRLAHIRSYEASYFAAAEFLLAGTFQWLVVGRWVEVRWVARKFSKKLG
jgi:hypothetical protein